MTGQSGDVYPRTYFLLSLLLLRLLGAWFRIVLKHDGDKTEDGVNNLLSLSLLLGNGGAGVIIVIIAAVFVVTNHFCNHVAMDHH